MEWYNGHLVIYERSSQNHVGEQSNLTLAQAQALINTFQHPMPVYGVYTPSPTSIYPEN